MYIYYIIRVISECHDFSTYFHHSLAFWALSSNVVLLYTHLISYYYPDVMEGNDTTDKSYDT